MPIYEYHCKGCDKTFEVTQRISEDPLSECPHCGSAEVQRLISATAFHLKGTGWYKTDYASSSGGAASSSAASSSDGDSSTSASSSSGTSEKADTSKSDGSSGAETTSKKAPASSAPAEKKAKTKDAS